MCINEKVSLGTFTICSLASLYLLKRNNKNDRWIGISFFYLGLMQLLEYLMWKDQECKGLNQMATDLGFIHSILQPVLSLLIAYYFTGGKLPLYVYVILILYLTISLPEIIKAKSKNQCSKPCTGSVDGLTWEYTKMEKGKGRYIWGIFVLAVAIPFLGMEGSGKMYTGIILASYILAQIIAIKRCATSEWRPTAGSWWCLMAVFIPLLAIKLNK